MVSWYNFLKFRLRNQCLSTSKYWLGLCPTSTHLSYATDFKQEDTTHNMSAGESQSTSNNAGTEYTMHSGPTDIDTDVERHLMNGKLIFNSVYR